MTNRERLTSLGACHEAVEWVAKYKTPLAAWKACKRGDFLLWYCGKVSGPPDSPSRRKLVLVAALCAETALPLIKDDEETRAICEATIQTCYAHAHGEATLEDVRSAYADAITAATAAAYVAIADAITAVAAAAYVAAATASTASAANNAAAAYAAAARAKSLATCADIVRANYPKPPEAYRRSQHEHRI
jgi:hypothetical protein